MKDILVTYLMTPNGGAPQFQNTIALYLCKGNQESRPVCMLGDFNLHLFDNKNDSVAKDLIDAMYEHFVSLP